MPIDFPSTPALFEVYTASGTSWQWDGTAWNVLSANNILTIPPSSNSFQNVAVTGQSSVVADSPTDTLTLIAGSNVTLTTNAVNDSITISAATGAEASDSFVTFAVAGQDSVVADSATDSITLVAGSGMSITTNATTDEITFESNSAATFGGLPDIVSTSLTVDKIYLPAITMLNVSNQGATSYRFDQYGTVDNPTIYAINGTTIAFNLNVTGHPFLIQSGAGSNFNTGLIHVSTSGVVSTGSSAQGQTSGTLYWKIPDIVSGGYRYQCSLHGVMVGSIVVKNFGSI
jgi:plastocyanin